MENENGKTCIACGNDFADAESMSGKCTTCNERDAAEMKQTRKEVKEIDKPHVLKDSNGNLTIIYNGSVEFYKLESKQTKKEIDTENPDCSWDYEEIYGKGWNKASEAFMAKSNGYRQVGLKRGD